jgi:glucan phosphoethanolaminetransferase (alkaline phosphatase superfamily)
MRSLRRSTISVIFDVVFDLLNVFRIESRPEYRLLGLFVPWIFIVSLVGFFTAWIVVAIIERTGLSRQIWHLPLFFLALVVLFTSMFGYLLFP